MEGFFKSGVTRAVLKKRGTWPILRDLLQMTVNMGIIVEAIRLKLRAGKGSSRDSE